MLNLCKIWVESEIEIWCFEVFYAKEWHQQRMSLCCNLKTHFHKYFFFMSNCDNCRKCLSLCCKPIRIKLYLQPVLAFWHNTRLVAPKIYTKLNLKRGYNFGFNDTWLVMLTNFNFVEIISMRKIKFWIFLWKA